MGLRLTSIGHVEPDLCLEVENRVVSNDRDPDLNREGGVFRQLASCPGIKRKEQAALLAGSILQVHPNVIARIQRDEPVIRKAQIECRSELEVPNVFLHGVSGDTGLEPDSRFEIAG